jgi:hypothetical protein
MNADIPHLTPDLHSSLETSKPTTVMYRYHPAMLYAEAAKDPERKSPLCTTVELRDNEAKMLTFQYVQTELNEKNRYFSAKIVSTGKIGQTSMMLKPHGPPFVSEKDSGRNCTSKKDYLLTTQV